MNRLRCVISGCVLTLAAAQLHAGDPDKYEKKYEIKVNLAADQKWSFEQTGKVKMEIHGSGAAPTSKEIDLKQSGTITNLQVASGQPTEATLVFDKDCQIRTTATDTDGTTTKPLALAGQTVQVNKSGRTFTIEGADADQSNADVVRGVMLVDRTVLPDKPVHIADRWDGDGEALRKLINLGDGQPVVPLICKLVAIGDVNGRPTADIEVAGQAAEGKGIAGGLLSVTGKVRIDLATGQSLESDFKTHTVVELLAGAVTADVTSEIHQSRRLIQPAK